MYSCPNCSTPVQYHRVCEECGTYRGKQAIEKQASV
jgi:large subunit ribosomal protein L32